MSRVFIIFLLLTSWLTLSCDGDLREIAECYTLDECAEDQICVQLNDSDEIVKYGVEVQDDPKGGVCVSNQRCDEIPSLLQDLRRAYSEPDADGVIAFPDHASSLEICQVNEPTQCTTDEAYHICEWRDQNSNINSGCHFHLPGFPEAYPEITSWFSESEETCAQGSACMDESGVVCVPSCSTDSECGGGEICRNSQTNGILTCDSAYDGPTVDSMCTLTVINAVVDGSGIEGININDPDLYVVLTVGEREERTGVAEGTSTPTWNHSFPELPWSQLAQMRLVLWDDDVSIIWRNDDDFVFEWDKRGGQWWAPMLEHTFTLSGGPVEQLTAQLSCR